jgi:hypothetical protein
LFWRKQPSLIRRLVTLEASHSFDVRHRRHTWRLIRQQPARYRPNCNKNKNSADNIKSRSRFYLLKWVTIMNADPVDETIDKKKIALLEVSKALDLYIFELSKKKLWQLK